VQEQQYKIQKAEKGSQDLEKQLREANAAAKASQAKTKEVSAETFIG
jgi:hypothetical protein